VDDVLSRQRQGLAFGLELFQQLSEGLFSSFTELGPLRARRGNMGMSNADKPRPKKLEIRIYWDAPVW
jgi:hypothetical protein